MDPAKINDPQPVELTRLQRRQIADILIGRRNELAVFVDRSRRDGTLPRVVEVGLDRELDRYSRLTKLIEPPKEPVDEEDFHEERD